ncbi:MAG: alpha/beta fold hydrolase [Pseudomonadales bacterium]|nr:alpha/beta fold hydrolase [Pseudomonadales bacterium]MDP6472932.1 alpha/beta fold hydrolase [Pseudomonadales bacterium]MDP6826311.1 alpha/beta fold hydrolase [Pseudomonadales bacterium]MDP6972772.1 alpha/beta fold hydrolase [Pseudomonadales bacterium]
MKRLTPSRLFSNPPLNPSLPDRILMSPDGQLVTYLLPAADDRERLDLWRHDLDSGESRLWLDGRELESAGLHGLSSSEKAARERKRQFAHGITDYHWSNDGTMVLLPASGSGFLMDARSGNVQRVTPGGRHTDLTLSPCGHYLSYVREGSLFVLQISSREERCVARSTHALESFGIAEFIAQEEMHRFHGHWWHPESRYLALTRVDETPVAISNRFEIGAETFDVFEQRYPYSGEQNAEVALLIHELASGETHTIDYAQDPQDYLARVDFVGEELAFQVEDRAQQRLDVHLFDPGSRTTRKLICEQAPHWVNLNDHLTAIGQDDYLWVSDRGDGNQLLRIRDGGVETVTSGVGRINEILHADADNALVTGWVEEPTEQHVYRIALAGGTRQRLTGEPGWHEAVADKEGECLVVRRTSLDNPGELTVLGRSHTPDIIQTARITAQHPYHAFLDAHITPELGSLAAADGQTLHYRLTRPRAEAPVPIIVYVYGGPGVQRVRNEWPPLTLQLLAQSGFGVFELDNRGSGNRGPRFEAPIYGRLGAVEVEDQIAGARFATGLDWVDGERIGVFGHSYGGYMTLMCLCRAPALFRAGVSVAPVSDWHLYDTHYTERYLGHPDQNEDGYRDSSVFAHLESLRGKLLLMHGMADDNVLFTHTTRLMHALQQRAYPFELMTYPGSKHALQEREVSIHRFEAILDFFRRQL